MSPEYALSTAQDTVASPGYLAPYDPDDPLSEWPDFPPNSLLPQLPGDSSLALPASYTPPPAELADECVG
jgi:hypothetical protein